MFRGTPYSMAGDEPVAGDSFQIGNPLRPPDQSYSDQMLPAVGFGSGGHIGALASDAEIAAAIGCFTEVSETVMQYRVLANAIRDDVEGKDFVSKLIAALDGYIVGCQHVEMQIGQYMEPNALFTSKDYEEACIHSAQVLQKIKDWYDRFKRQSAVYYDKPVPPVSSSSQALEIEAEETQAPESPLLFAEIAVPDITRYHLKDDALASDQSGDEEGEEEEQGEEEALMSPIPSEDDDDVWTKRGKWPCGVFGRRTLDDAVSSVDYVGDEVAAIRFRTAADRARAKTR